MQPHVCHLEDGGGDQRDTASLPTVAFTEVGAEAEASRPAPAQKPPSILEPRPETLRREQTPVRGLSGTFGLHALIVRVLHPARAAHVPATNALRNTSRNRARSASSAPRGTWIGSPNVISQHEKGSGIWNRSQLLSWMRHPTRQE